MYKQKYYVKNINILVLTVNRTTVTQIIWKLHFAAYTPWFLVSASCNQLDKLNAVSFF